MSSGCGWEQIIYIPSINLAAMKKTLLPIAVAGIWITASEFVRNEFLLKSYWVGHFEALGLRFETLPLNGMLWMVWSFILAYLIFRLLQKFHFWEAICLAWLPAFAMMWITIYNLQVLPLMLLVFAVPLSLIEVAVAALIIKKIK
jgi:hypothetical protein